MTRKFVVNALFSACALLAGGTVANAATLNLVTNGSFEDPGVGSGSWSALSLPGWTSDEPIEVRNNVAGAAHSGDNYIELAHNNNDSIWQTIATKVGQLYEFSFAYSPRAGFNQGDDNKVRVSWDGVEINGSPLSGSGFNQSGNNWTVYSFLVSATKASTVIRFDSLSTPNDSYAASLDSVSVSAVPLPGAALLFASSLLGAGALRRRKAKQAAAGAGAVAA